MTINNGSSKLIMLAEQTAFLLKQQQEMKQYYEGQYADFLAVLDQHIKNAETSGSIQELEDLKFIRKVISEQAQELSKEIAEDINFLQSQLDGITQVRSLNDPAREQEFERLLLDGSQDLLPTEEFEAQVMNEVRASQSSFNAMLSDFKNSLNEGGGHTLAKLLEAMIKESGAAQGDQPTEIRRDEIGHTGSIDEEGIAHAASGDACCNEPDPINNDECCSQNVDILKMLREAENQVTNAAPSSEGSDEVTSCCKSEEKVEINMSDSTISTPEEKSSCNNEQGRCQGTCATGQGCSCGKNGSCKKEESAGCNRDDENCKREEEKKTSCCRDD